MLIVVVREGDPGETRVALMPESVRRLQSLEVDVAIESGVGAAAGVSDEEYIAAGATVSSDRMKLLSQADALVTVGSPSAEMLQNLPRGALVVGLIKPMEEPRPLAIARDRSLTTLALDLVPRTSRAQPMDALSSMATVSGYKAVLMAATRLPRMFPLLMTAAGTVPPARILVLGAGIAGLQAVATARRLGAVVEVFDLRAHASEEVASLGATFLHLDPPTDEAFEGGRPPGERTLERVRELITRSLRQTDVIICTVPGVVGRRAPTLLSAEAISHMKRGSIVVDLAAASGGNCAVSKPGEVVESGGVTIMAPLNLPASVPGHASQLYARNVTALLQVVIRDGSLHVDLQDDVVSATCITHQGRVLNARVEAALSAGSHS